MEIEKHKFVTLNYLLKNDKGEKLTSSEEEGPISYIHGTGNLMSGLEDALTGKSAGDSFSITLSPEKAYGSRDESLVHVLGRDQFADFNEINPGMQVHVHNELVNQVMTVTKFENDEVTLDGNHPLAGLEINIELDITEVRDATVIELEQIYSKPNSCGGGCSSGCDAC